MGPAVRGGDPARQPVPQRRAPSRATTSRSTPTTTCRYFEAAAAALHAGLYLTPVNAHSSPDEAEYVINDCGADALIVADSTVEVAQGLVGRTPGVRLRLTLDGTPASYRSVDEAVPGQPAEPTAPERRGTYMFYSSGTTGRPKGIKPPLPDAPAMAGDVIGRHDGPPLRRDEDAVYLSPAPLHHAAPLRTSCSVLELGTPVVVMERFDAESALAAIEHYRVTSSQWVPTMFVRMLKLDPAVPRPLRPLQPAAGRCTPPPPARCGPRSR